MLASLFLIGAAWPLPQMTVQAANQTIVEDDPGATTRAANRILGGIISYVRWPGGQQGASRMICVAGSPRLTGRIAPVVPGGPAVTVRRAATAETSSAGACDILFLGRMSDIEERRWIGWTRGRAVLTVTDDDPDCLRGAMFCLAPRPGGLGFAVNLDAIGRGGLRVDPRVLKIGQGDGGAP